LSLPTPDKVVRREGFSTKILDRNGKSLYDISFDGERRTPVKIDDIPLYLRQATISIEDKNFYKHQGFDVTGYARAIYNIIFHQKLQGGSTLTQQLVKIVLLTQDRTLWRKIRELVLTLQVESRYSKDEILQMYLNEIPYGGPAIGAEAAAEMYLGKKVKDLNLTESAFLAALPQRPSYYSPYSSQPRAYVDRATSVLRRMREDGYINADQEKQALEGLPKLEFQPQGASFRAPHFVQYVQRILEERYGENSIEQGGLTVTTSLDDALQEEAQTIVADEISKAEKLNITNGAVVVLNPQTGEILAMVGSKNFNAKDYDGQYNVATALRQPGSAIKPITYVTALKKGMTASTVLMDVPTSFPAGPNQPDYIPQNYDGKFRGPVLARYALGNSLNIPAVKMLAKVGIKDMLQTAYDLGIESLPPTQQTLSRVGLSVTLGGGEVELLNLTRAYTAFSNGGYRVDPVAILKVTDHNGKVLETVTPEKGKQVLSSEDAFIMADMLSDNAAREWVFGLNSLLNIPKRKILVKTGTTNDRRDNWAIGGDTQVMVGAWVGNNNNSAMKSVASGVSGASPIWRRVLLESLKDKPVGEFQVPEGVVQMEIDSLSGYKAHDGFPARMEYFKKGTEPGDDPMHVKLKLCKAEGRLATPSDIAAFNYDEKEFIMPKEDDPLAKSGDPNRWQEGINNWLATQSDQKYHPPTEYCGGSNPINVEFVSPKDRDSNLPNTFNIKAVAQSTKDIAIVELEVDGTKVRSFADLPYEHEVTLPNGVHTIRAIAYDAQGKSSDRKITIGVGVPWDFVSATPAPTP
jgi:1A family penicillin-binding protein